MSFPSSSANGWSGSATRSSPSPPPIPQRSPPTPTLWSPSGSTEMDENDPFLQTPIVCCGGEDAADQDVTISLVLPRLPWEETHYPPLAEVRVHSNRLRSCSKYYATALGPPCPKRKRTPLACKLKLFFADETVYCDCFRRMYTPFRKDFGAVSYALQLLRVASQIEFEELSRAICSYLSSVQWSGEEDLEIRRYVASPDFPRDQGEELLARVARKEDPSGSFCLLIQHCMHYASLHNVVDNNPSRALLEELLRKAAEGRQSECSTFEQDVVTTIINEEAKRLIEDVHMNYDSRVESFQQVCKLRTVRYVLEALVGASLGEAGVKCFLRLENYPSILAHTARILEWEIHVVATEFGRLLLSICTNVVVGNLVLEVRDRVALLKNWRRLFQRLDMMESFKPLAASLFSTLPFPQQMELINDKSQKDNFDTYMSTPSFVRLLKDQWPVADDAGMQVEMD